MHLSKKNKLYLTTGAALKLKNLAQDDNSVYGKIIEIDLSSNNFKIRPKTPPDGEYGEHNVSPEIFDSLVNIEKLS